MRYVAPRAVIVVIGNEILNGETRDTSSGWLCTYLCQRGMVIEAISTVRDEPHEIVSAVRAGLSRNVDLLVTLGGLGPTADDLTLAAVAEALDRPVRRDQQAEALVVARYEALSGQLATPAAEAERAARRRLKMADLPASASILTNSVGAAPGIAIRSGNTVLLCLPGVPSEMRSMIQAADDLLRKWVPHGARAQGELSLDSNDESVLAPALEEVAAKHPLAYVKSHAGHFAETGRLRVTVTALGSSTDDATQRLREASTDLIDALSRHHVAVTRQES
jgi:molybdenum cofactor synthesis domain-containing protein